jgi:uncharacterized protein YcbK (DUF882 family)
VREQLTENFYRDEFACNCGCGFDTVDFALVKFLQSSRDHFDRVHAVTSGCRCPAHNKSVGGAIDSQHLLGRAADYVVDGVPAEIAQEFADQYGIPGLGRYEGFTHADTRKEFARW